jgi:hypothetical protein
MRALMVDSLGIAGASGASWACRLALIAVRSWAICADVSGIAAFRLFWKALPSGSGGNPVAAGVCGAFGFADV